MIIGPPMSGMPFVTRYLVADRDTRFDYVRVITGSEYGKIAIVSDPSESTGNTMIDPRSGDETQIAEYRKLRTA